MYQDLLKEAKQRVPGTSVLINMVSMRAKQLIAGQRPLIKSKQEEDLDNIALNEIAEGKIVAEIDFTDV